MFIAGGFETINGTGSDNIGIGNDCDNSGYSNTICLGNGATATNNNQINIGNSTYNEIILSNTGPSGSQNYTFIDGLFILPRTFRPATGPTGSICYDADDNQLYFYNGITWNNLY